MTRLHNRRVERHRAAWWQMRRWYGHADVWLGETRVGQVCTGPHWSEAGARRALDALARVWGAS